MCSATPIVSVPVPVGWTPQTAIAARFPEIAELARSAHHEIQTIEAELDRREAAGANTSCPRQILRELRWRLEYTADTNGIRAALAQLRSRAANRGRLAANSPAKIAKQAPPAAAPRPSVSN